MRWDNITEDNIISVKMAWNEIRWGDRYSEMIIEDKVGKHQIE